MKENKINEIDEDCREHALSALQVGSDFKEWIKTAKKCERVIVAWGDCGSGLKEIQWAKDKVIFALFVEYTRYILLILSHEKKVLRWLTNRDRNFVFTSC